MKKLFMAAALVPLFLTSCGKTEEVKIIPKEDMVREISAGSSTSAIKPTGTTEKMYDIQQQKSADTIRIMDLRNIAAGLDAYYMDKGVFPQGLDELAHSYVKKDPKE